MGEHPSYHASITGSEAEKRLAMFGDLCYLTRFSEERQCYILSIYKPGPVKLIKHFKLVIDEDGKHSIDGKMMTFPNIGKLLAHYESTERPDPAFRTIGRCYTEQDYSQAEENRRAEQQRRAEEERQERIRREADERKIRDEARRAAQMRYEEQLRNEEQLRRADELIRLREAENVRQTEQLRRGEDVETLRQEEVNQQAQELIAQESTQDEGDGRVVSSGSSDPADSHYRVGQAPGARSGRQPPRNQTPGQQPVGGQPAGRPQPGGPASGGQSPRGPPPGGGGPTLRGPPPEEQPPVGPPPGGPSPGGPMRQDGNRRGRWRSCTIL